jgi:manganese/zinc/iron transport system substrate-binding protein
MQASRLHLTWVLLACWLALAGKLVVGSCSAQEQVSLKKVVVTTGLVADLVSSVAGTQVSLTSLMGSGVDPHLYKATQGDLLRLREADLIFYNGLHLEGKLAEVLEKFSKRRPTVAVSRSIGRAQLLAPPEFEGQFDPHIWFDVQLWLSALDVVAEELKKLIPEKNALFEERRLRYAAELQQLDAWMISEIKTIPPERRVLITAHDAFGYFGRRYGLEVLALQGISTASEFGLSDVTSLTQIIQKRKIPAIFVESSVPHRFIEALLKGVQAQGGQVKLGGELYSDALGAQGTATGTYVGMLRHNVNTIVAALR